MLEFVPLLYTDAAAANIIQEVTKERVCLLFDSCCPQPSVPDCFASMNNRARFLAGPNAQLFLSSDDKIEIEIGGLR
jgi:hypothetical protein